MLINGWGAATKQYSKYSHSNITVQRFIREMIKALDPKEYESGPVTDYVSPSFAAVCDHMEYLKLELSQTKSCRSETLAVKFNANRLRAAQIELQQILTRKKQAESRILPLTNDTSRDDRRFYSSKIAQLQEAAKILRDKLNALPHDAIPKEQLQTIINKTKSLEEQIIQDRALAIEELELNVLLLEHNAQEKWTIANEIHDQRQNIERILAEEDKKMRKLTQELDVEKPKEPQSSLGFRFFNPKAWIEKYNKYSQNLKQYELNRINKQQEIQGCTQLIGELTYQMSELQPVFAKADEEYNLAEQAKEATIKATNEKIAEYQASIKRHEESLKNIGILQKEFEEMCAREEPLLEEIGELSKKKEEENFVDYNLIHEVFLENRIKLMESIKQKIELANLSHIFQHH